MKKKPSNKSKPIPSVDELIRHQNVLFEQIRDEVKGVAEGHSSLDRKLDKTNERLDGMEDTLQIISGKLSEHSSKLAEHDKRFDRVESAIIENSKDIQLLKATTNRIEEKLDTVTVDHEQRIQKLETMH